ncbi:fasciclin domain-containing protein [Nonomuraea terrae]|uniref:fasciclin domain-containing protein n=1 Tax=Nonomuraea terrae TaxID=2530383 RepID=UPI001FE8642B|nr:fasciclin domain-containing protein [Nonomuraea terrae]
MLLAAALALTASTAGTAEASILTLPAASPSPEDTSTPESPTTTASPIGPGCASIEDSLSNIADQPVGTALSQVPELSMLSQAVKKAGLENKLNSAQDITVFAPSNEAFEAIPPDARDKVMADKQALTKVLSYHVVEGKKAPADLEGATLKNMLGGELTVKGSGEDLTINNAKMVCGDVPTSNATVYIVDKVLMPQ